MNLIESDEINIIFTYESQKENTIKCNINEKVINILQKYSKLIGKELNSLYFICNGARLDDYEKTINEIANKINISNMEINILVYEQSDSVNGDDTKNIYFLEENNTIKIPCKKDDKIKTISEKYEHLTKFNHKSVIYKYKGQELDLEKTFDDYNIKEKDIFINVDKKTLLYIIFSYLNIKYTIECYKEDKIEDICSDFASKNKIDKKKLIFKYKDNIVDKNQTLNQFFNNNNIININEIVIDAIDIPFPPISPSFLITHKIKLIIIASITIVSTIAIPTVIAIKNKNKDTTTPVPSYTTTPVTSDITIVTSTTTTVPDTSKPSNTIPDTSTLTSVPSTIVHSTEPLIKCDVGYKLDYYGQCNVDYFIKAIYSSKANEYIRLISDEYNLNKIRTMIIDGKYIKPTKYYTFNEYGSHTILFSFFPYNISTKNEAIGIFNGIENLLNVEFSSYKDDYPDVRFIKMFNNCINLISVDFSKISFYETSYSIYDYSEYFNIFDYTFNNCINLKYVNFSISIPPVCITIHSTKFMFNNCISLTSINLSVFCYDFDNYENIKSSGSNNMFSNCISLKEINSGYTFFSNDPTNVSYMFYNCSLLTSVDLSSSGLIICDMSYMFAYCYQLKELIFTSEIGGDHFKYMSNAFRNCTSLVNATLPFYTKSVEDMSFLFYGCISLTYIFMSSFTIENYVNSKYMNYMFYDCRSLKSISHLDFFTNRTQVYFNNTNLQDISYMFSGCSSLTSIDLSKFITKNVKNYEGLFNNCPKLEYIDISPFTHNNLPKSNLSIFNNNYPLKGTIIINKDFHNRAEIPKSLKTEIINNNN